MNRCMSWILLSVAVLTFAGTVNAENVYWRGDLYPANDLWSDAGNWTVLDGGNYVPTDVPDAADDVFVLINPSIVDSDVGSVNTIQLGLWGIAGTMNVNSGGSVIANVHTLMGPESGVVSTLNIAGGYMITGALAMGWVDGSTSSVNIDSGHIHAGALLFGPGAANIDLEEGAYLFLNGDVTGDVETWIAAGLITGADNTSGLDYDYNETVAGLTAVYVPEPASLLILAVGSVFLRRRK